MKIELKKIDSLKRELKFEIPKDRISKEFEQVYTEIGRVAKVRGFRPGKAPRHLIESQHNKLAEEEVIKKVIPEAYREGLTKEKLSPLDMPEIHDLSLKDGILTFTAKFDIKPEIKIKDYKGIVIKRKKNQVTDEEINKTLEYFQKGQGEEKGTMIDDAFARGLGYPTLEEFKATLRRQMEMEKDRQNRADLENQLVENLLSQAKLTAPQSLVNKQLEVRLAETKKKLKDQRMPDAEIAKREESMRADLKAAIEKDICVYLVLEKIAELENIHTHHENENLMMKVMEFLLKEAKWEEA